MVIGLAYLLAFQLAGEVSVRLAGVPVPGPVIGMGLLLAAMRLSSSIADHVAPISRVLLANLSLLFVPAGVGIIGHLNTLGSDGVGLAAAIASSTVLALVAAVWTFIGVRRMLVAADD